MFNQAPELNCGDEKESDDEQSGHDARRLMLCCRRRLFFLFLFTIFMFFLASSENEQTQYAALTATTISMWRNSLKKKLSVKLNTTSWMGQESIEQVFFEFGNMQKRKRTEGLNKRRKKKSETLMHLAVGPSDVRRHCWTAYSAV